VRKKRRRSFYRLSTEEQGAKKDLGKNGITAYFPKLDLEGRSPSVTREEDGIKLLKKGFLTGFKGGRSLEREGKKNPDKYHKILKEDEARMRR